MPVVGVFRKVLLASLLLAWLQVPCNLAQAQSAAIESRNVQVGVRPYQLIDAMADSPLKRELQACSERPLQVSNLAIAHRGAPLQFPEHTRESYLAAARMGAGTIECDVTFTRDRALVCRHAQCDLHETTNILDTPLAARCSEPFRPAQFDARTGAATRPASARCCASDITLAEFKSLCGKMEGHDPRAQTPAEYMAGTPRWRTELYANRCATLLSHRESIALIDELGLNFTPELKTPEVAMPFATDFDQRAFADRMLAEYREAGIAPNRVWPQSFDVRDIQQWLDSAPEFGSQAVFLDGRARPPTDFATAVAEFEALHSKGFRYLAPHFTQLLEAHNGELVPSLYARAARAAQLKLITWSLERMGPDDYARLRASPLGELVRSDADLYVVLDALVRRVGVRGVFSDWPGTVTYYANCVSR